MPAQGGCRLCSASAHAEAECRTADCTPRLCRHVTSARGAPFSAERSFSFLHNAVYSADTAAGAATAAMLVLSALRPDQRFSECRQTTAGLTLASMSNESAHTLRREQACIHRASAQPAIARCSLILGRAGGHGDLIVDIGDQLVVKIVQRHIRDIQSDDSLRF